jgi:prepilin signal peptidase PulO-like enzyme (type II secretory pathway)
VGLGLIIWSQLRKRKHGNYELNSGDKSLTIKSEIPFGPFLIFGIFLVFVFGIDFFSLLKF